MVCTCTLALLAVLTAIVILSLYAYLKSCHTYWKRKGLDYLEPEFFYGNIRRVIKREVAYSDLFLEFYKDLKARGLRHGGGYSFFKPMYIPLDPEIIKCIMQKDFNHFVNHGTNINEKADPLSGHLFNLEDTKWRNLRVKLTPTFTSGKMRMMFQTLVECSYDLEAVLTDYATVQDPADIRDIFARFTTDVIASCAFGIECKSLKNPNSEFRKYGKKIFMPGFTTRIKMTFAQTFPMRISRKFGLKQTDRDIESFFIDLVKDTVEYREKNNVYRKDFMHLLLQLRNRGKITDDEDIKQNAKTTENSNAESKMTIPEIAAQCFVFFLAGFHTSSTTITYALYRLSKSQEMQQKLRKEVLSVLKKHNDKLTYEAIMEMTYMEKVINETLRMHPPLPTCPRVCNKSFRVPGADIVIEPWTRVHIPIVGLHYDPDYYPDPETFDPERFSEENKAKRPAFTFLPFGEGPRICIGSRFGMMQIKVGLASIIAKFAVTLNEKTETPIKLDPGSFLSAAKGGVWLNIIKLE